MQHLPQKIVCSEHSFASTHVHKQTNFDFNIVVNMAYLQYMYCIDMYQSYSLCAVLYWKLFVTDNMAFPKASGSKCVDYSSIHLYNACDNGIKQLPWEKSVWRMDYSKALPMGRWTQELSQAVSISSGCSASEKCSDAAFHVHILFSGEKTWDGEATVV